MTTQTEKLNRAINRAAYAERDTREYYKTINVLKAAGVITEDQYEDANSLVMDGRDTDPFVAIDRIKHDIRELIKGDE